MEDILANIYTSALIGKIVYLAVVVGIALLVQRVIVRGLKRALDAAGVPKASIFVNIVRAVIWAFALLAVLQPVFGVQPTAFVAALGVTSVVISFGLQDTVSNIVAGLGLMMGRVVRPGDQVTVGGFTGEVVDVTWRSTMVRDKGGKVEVIPNSVLNKTALTRETAWSVTDCPVEFYVEQGSDLDAVTLEVQRLAGESCGPALVPDFSTEVLFDGLGPLGIHGTAHLHLVAGSNYSAQADALVRALSRAPWIARPASGVAEAAANAHATN
ncbi:MAG: mechanosensitive ion channel family protein [Olsenella sp.]|jgi:small-conductance mechanosensitive channel|nr:mechanosensitive ion channel family protein [Olsenella sp.]MCI1792869.1 mechanosensitive ion channel family protein [Olsenella sp.]MCI1879508.1 mechanosensitive ion channel family protein [Olsenella sp.]